MSAALTPAPARPVTVHERSTGFAGRPMVKSRPAPSAAPAPPAANPPGPSSRPAPSAAPAPPEEATGAPGPAAGFHGAVSAFKRRLIETTLTELGGNRTRAARALGLQRTYLLRLMREFEVHVPAANGHPRRPPDGSAPLR